MLRSLVGSEMCIRDSNKCVVGFDHHCIYLNQCVGARNYKPWYTLLFTFCINIWMEAGLNCYGIHKQIHEGAGDAVVDNINNDVGGDFYRVLVSVCLMIELAGGLFSLDLFIFHARLRQLSSPGRPMTTLLWMGLGSKYPEMAYNLALRRVLNDWLTFDQDQKVVQSAYTGMLANYRLEQHELQPLTELTAGLVNACVFCRSGELLAANDEGSGLGTTLAEPIAAEERSCADSFARANFVLVSATHDDVARNALSDPDKEAADLNDLFGKLDVNADGYLSQEELSSAISHLGLDPSIYLTPLQGMMTDVQGKMVLTLDRLQRGVGRVSSMKKAASAANLFDKSIKGTNMTLSELEALEAEYNKQFSADKSETCPDVSAREILKFFDEDGDGELSKKEFIEAVLGQQNITMRESAQEAIIQIMQVEAKPPSQPAADEVN
eukprot:TRINITY_DN4981_c0_g1_i1.p1 TRINITY_DN4981_c0_g1~~TRINITY_DN4981_c0_g1_i1.p1  ORF type:complete len:438 (-),score=96.68 TRINITY_DN4981_c0_g1_i1:348-1661(-)